MKLRGFGWLGFAAIAIVTAAGCGTQNTPAGGPPAMPVGFPVGLGGGGGGGTTGSGHIRVSPSKVNVPPGGDATLAVRVDRTGDFTETVNIDVTGAPPDVHVTAPAIAGSAGTITLTADRKAAHPTPMTLSLDAGDAGSADVSMTVRGAPGTIDLSWGTDGAVDTALAPNTMAVDGLGRLVVGGGIAAAPFALERFQPDGTVDTSFGSGGVVLVEGTAQAGAAAISALADDSLLVGSDGRGGSEVIRFRPDGSIDTTWGDAGFAVTQSRAGAGWRTDAMRPLPAGGAVNTGELFDSDNTRWLFVAMWDASGAAASSFQGGRGYALFDPWGPYEDNEGTALRVDAKGRIVDAITGSGGGGVGRLLPNGDPDLTFGSGGWAWPGLANARALFLDDSARILVAGGSFPDYDLAIARLDDAGAPDPGFGTGGVAVLTSAMSANVHALTFDAGRPLVVGAASTVHPEGSWPALARVDPNGVPDATFGSGGGVAYPLQERTEALSIYVVPGEGRAIVLDQNRVLIRVWL